MFEPEGQRVLYARDFSAVCVGSGELCDAYSGGIGFGSGGADALCGRDIVCSVEEEWGAAWTVGYCYG